jgi:protein-tyrosine-phosphatase
VLRDDYGIDIAGQRPRHLDTVTGHRYDHVITLCDRAREVCPDFPDRPRRAHWSIPEPDGDPAVRRTANDIDTRVRHLLPLLAARPAKENRS